MPRAFAASIFWCLFLMVPLNASADDFFIYPNKNQSAVQQERDKSECRSWANQQTGFDPAQRPTASSPPPTTQAPKGGLVRGASRGVALGAIGGAISGNAGKGAAMGAAMGGMTGVMRRNDQRREEEYSRSQWASQNAAEYEQKRSTWTRALNACLTGRGYTVQ